MALATYPSTLPLPDIALQGNIGLPLKASDMNAIGAYRTRRDKTRAYIRCSSSILFETADLPVFLTFFNTTLNGGMKSFKADWISYIGIKGYVGKIVGFKIGLKGVKPTASSIDFEFCPHVQYDITTPTLPSPWPEKADA